MVEAHLCVILSRGLLTAHVTLKLSFSTRCRCMQHKDIKKWNSQYIPPRNYSSQIEDTPVGANNTTLDITKTANLNVSHSATLVLMV